MTTYSDIRKKHLAALEEIQTEGLREAEGRLFRLLAKLKQAFEIEEYFHLPVEFELADRQYLDDIFESLYNTLVEATDLLAALDTRVEGMVDKLDTTALAATVESLRVEFQARVLRTGGEGTHVQDSQFTNPLTLAPTGVTPITFEEIQFVNGQSFPHSVYGKVQTLETTPVAFINENGVPFPNLPGASVQLVAKNRPLRIADLNAAVGEDISQADYLQLDAQSVAGHFTGSDDVAAISITARLETPSILSLIQTPIQDGITCHVELTTLEGNNLVYPSVEELIYVDNPTDLITSITWVFPLSGIPTETLGGLYYGHILSIGDSNGDTQTHALLQDLIAEAVNA